MSDEDTEAAPHDVPRWRADFPIRWALDHYVTRRELAKFLTLGSALLAAGSAVIAAVGKWHRPAPFPEVRIAGAAAIPVGGSALFRYPTEEDPCIVVRGKDGALRAYSQVCTHLSCAVVHRSESDELFCPCHKGYFSARDGRPIAGPPVRRLPMIRLEQRGDEVLAIGKEVWTVDAHAQGTTLMTAICSFIVVLLVIQIWLVSAALEALLSGDHAVLVPAAIASGALFLVNGGLLLFALRYDRRMRGAPE